MSGLSTSAMDKRAFKGKGGSEGMSQWVLEWQSRNARALDRVIRDMEAVAQESKKMPGNQWYLYLHYRKDTGQYFLMWRSYGARKHVHVSWDGSCCAAEGLLPVTLTDTVGVLVLDISDWGAAFACAVVSGPVSPRPALRMALGACAEAADDAGGVGLQSFRSSSSVMLGNRSIAVSIRLISRASISRREHKARSTAAWN